MGQIVRSTQGELCVGRPESRCVSGFHRTIIGLGVNEWVNAGTRVRGSRGQGRDRGGGAATEVLHRCTVGCGGWVGYVSLFADFGVVQSHSSFDARHRR